MVGVGANAGIGALTANVGVNLTAFNAGMDQVDRRALQTTSNLNKVGSAFSAGAGIGAGFAAVNTALSATAGLAQAAGSAVIGLNSDLEQAKIGFTSFLKDATKADAFVRQLQDFAAKTTFEFPGLLQSARQLTGMGVQAELVIPILKDVAGAVQGVGGGDVAIRRVNLALTQMMAAGKVNAQDMNQLAQAGLPAWQMLADSMGMTIGQVKELSKQGKVSAQQMLQAFHDFVQNNGLSELAERAGRTWQAATSNIIDGLRNVAAEGFEPLFNVMRDAAVRIADFLVSDQVKQFGADTKATLQEIITSLQPVQDAFSKAFTILQTDGMSAALGSLLTDINNFAKSMGGAGYQLVSEFASGILDAANSLITDAANAVAEIIASYLIGNSPPPVGPLSNIVAGGTAVIEAYVSGLAQGTAGVADVAQTITDAFGKVDGAMTLSEGRAALQAAGEDAKKLAEALGETEGVLRTLDDAIKNNQSSLRDYQNAATDIKDAYEAAIEPLQAQLDALKDINDLSQKQADIQDRIALAQLKGQLQKAQGDPIQRAQLQTRLDELEQEEKALSMQERQLTLNGQAAALAAKAKGEKYTDTALDQQKNALAQRRLGIQQQENTIQMQITGMVDKEAVARIKTQQAITQAAKDQRDINSEVAGLQRELAAAPIEAQIKELQGQQEALLRPIQDRIKETQREGQVLQEQRTAWQGIKQDIQDVTSAQREQAAQAKRDLKEAADEAKQAALGKKTDLTQIYTPEEIKQSAIKVGNTYLQGIKDYFAQQGPTLIGGAIGAILGAGAFGPLGAIAGATFGARLVDAIKAKIPDIGTILGDAFRTASQALQGDWEPPSADEWVNPFVESIGKAFSEIGAIIKKAQGGDISGAIIQALGDVGILAGKIATWLGDAVGQIPWADVWKVTVDVASFMAGWFVNIGTQFTTWITEQVGQIKWADVWAGIEATALEFWTSTKDLAARMQAWLTLEAQKIKWDAVFLVTDQQKETWKDTFTPTPTTWEQWFKDSWAAMTWENVFSTASSIGASLTTGLDAAIKGVSWTTLGQLSADLLIGAIKGVIAIGRGIHEVITGALQGMWEAGILGVGYHAMTAIGNFVQGFITEVALQLGLPETWTKIRDALVTNMAKVFALPTGPGEMVSGGGIALGLLQGLADSMKDSVINQTLGKVIQQAAALMIGLFKLSFGISSPSTIMIEMGGFLIEGLAQGITDGTTKVTGAITDQMTQALTEYTTGWTNIHTGSTAQLDEIYVLVQLKLTDMVGLVPPFMVLMLAEFTIGWTAIHTGTGTQLDEIYVLIQGKLTDMVGLVPPAMTEMMAAFATGFSAIHTQTTTQLGEIYTLIMMQSEQWRAAGLALGTALGEGIAAAQLNVQRSMMTMMGNVTGGSKASPEIQAQINAAAAKYKLPANLLTAQLQHESAGFDPRVISGARTGGSGELGIGQFMEPTLMAALKKNNLSLQQYLGNSQVQIELAAQHMSELVATFGDYDKALQAYNGGPGGVGSAATLKYAQIVHQVAETLQTSKTNMGSGGAQLMGLNTSQITAGQAGGLSLQEAAAFCGPYAAMLFAQATGRNPTVQEAKQLATAAGWKASVGMGGTGNFMGMLGSMGINAVRQQASAANVNAAAAGGNPFAISTPNHYFVGQGGTAEGGLNVGATGSVMSRTGGKAVMTLAEIEQVGGGINDLIVLTDKLDTSGANTFNNLTKVTGQFGDVLVTGVDEAQAGVEGIGAQGVAATQQIGAATQTLATSIQSGIVPAGLAARGAIGEMAIGIQPLISTWAQGGMTSDQLAESIVQLAAQTGLATAPLASFTAGNVSVGEALRQVMTQLAATDPAFATIQESMSGAQVSTEQLADTLLRGLSNVTGTVSGSLGQIARGALPLSQAFSTGAISGDQFVQSVVELAAQSGLTQAPLRLMQDGVITANEALAQVVTTAGQATPSLLGMSTGFSDMEQPATDAAQSFLDWAQAAKDSTATTVETSQVITDLPTAVEDIQAPMADASTAVMQTLPDATVTAGDATVQAIQGISGPAAAAATEVGNAIVEAIRSTVEAGAESIAAAATAIVEKALEAAKKAAEKVKESVKGKDGGGDSGGDGGETDAKAAGGRLNSGVWTLVGENGPELISPSGYVYNTSDTTSMLLKGITSGLFKLNSFASGGQMGSGGVGFADKSKTTTPSKSKDKEKDDTEKAANTTPKKFEAPVTKEELDLEQKILELTKQKDELIVKQLPLENAIRLAKREQEAALKGTLAQQLEINHNELMILDDDRKILELKYKDTDTTKSLFTLEGEMSDLKARQAESAKGDAVARAKLIELDFKRLEGEKQIAQLQEASFSVRQDLANTEKEIADIQKGSIQDQLQSQSIQAHRNINDLALNKLAQQSAGLTQQIAETEASINKTLAGTVQQRQQMAANAERMAQIDVQTLQVQGQLLPIQKQISDVQKQIEDASRGSLADQYEAIDVQTKGANLRLQEIKIAGQLRDVEAGVLNLSQTQINDLHKQLELVTNQKAQIQDQTEERQLQATINTAGAQKQLIGLQAQERAHNDVLDGLNNEKSVLQNNTDQINAQNTLSVTGQQAKLTDLNSQMTVYQEQVATLQAQNSVLDLQAENIRLSNTIRADALGAQLINLQAQVGVYDTQIGKIQQQNAGYQVQSNTILASNALAAAGFNAQIDALQQTLDMRQRDIDHLDREREFLTGQNSLITIQNTISGKMHDDNLIRLNNQKLVQDQVLEDITAQLGALNAQKQVYEDIRRLTEQIANRPVTPPSAPGAPGSGGSGPPGNVVATATKSSEPTLYLSRGTGTDGWYTSDGRLMVQGASSNPPGGYKVRWLAEGGLWRSGEMAVLGEEGPEIAVAARDMHVFPHEQSASIARAFGRKSRVWDGGDDANESSVNVTVHYHRHGGPDRGDASVEQVVREAVNTALRM